MKNKKILKIFLIAAVATSLICLPGCNEKNKTVKAGCFVNITHSQALYGENTGAFDECTGDGYELEWFVFNAGPAEMESMRAGKIDIGYVGPIPAINSNISSDGKIKIIAGASDAGSVLVTRGDLKLESIAQLDGLTVAVPQFMNTQDLLLRMLLDENGLSSTENGGTVNIIQQSNTYMSALFETKQIDAALVPEPWGTRLIEESGANVLLDSNEILGGDYTVAVIVANEDFIKENRDFVKVFLKAHIESTLKSTEDKDYAKKTNEWIEHLSSVKIEENILDKAFTRLTVTYDPNLDSIEKFVEISKKVGLISESVSIDELCDLSLLNEVLEELGLEKVEK